MTLFYYQPTFLEHDTGSHPENAGRLRAVMERLNSTELLDQCARPDWLPAVNAQLGYVHDQADIDSITKFVGDGGGRIEADTVVSEKSLDVARLAAGAGMRRGGTSDSRRCQECVLPGATAGTSCIARSTDGFLPFQQRGHRRSHRAP